MKAVSPYTGTVGSGEPQLPQWIELPDPVAGPGQVLVRVHSAALNRGDLLQMRGLYPPPPGASTVPGLECAGVVEAVGAGVDELAVGDEVVGLLEGGGQAELVTVDAGQLFAKPDHLSWVQAGGLAEVALTSWTNLVFEGGLQAGQTVLITAAASGVGSYCVPLARELGATVLVAGRKRRRLEALEDRGAAGVVLLGDDVAAQVRNFAPEGVDLILDLVGGPGLAQLLPALRDRGRLVLLGLLGGVEATLPLGDILRRRLEIRGSVLRSRSGEEKRGLIRSFGSFAAARWASGRLDPLVDSVLPMAECERAYRRLAEDEVFGKIVLTTDSTGDLGGEPA